MKYRKVIAVFFASLLVPSCGIEENFYLPQVPQNSITRQLNTDATIVLPALDQYYYAQSYLIYYRIYISGIFTGADIQSPSERGSISTDLANDFNSINPYADPTSQTSSNVSGILTGRGYFELELDGANISSFLPASGGTVTISFPENTGYPAMSFNNGQEVRLRRSSELISPQPVGDFYFRNSDELSDPANSNSNTNADVASRSGGSTGFAYASMYIVAAGLDTASFRQIYSKPTHISIFKLPNN